MNKRQRKKAQQKQTARAADDAAALRLRVRKIMFRMVVGDALTRDEFELVRQHSQFDS